MICRYTVSKRFMTATHSESPALTVYFDGACPVCSREIAYYRRQPGAQACAWVDATACAESALGPGLTRSAALGRFHVRRADGELVDGMRGFAALWRALPRTAWLGRLASFGPVPALLEAAYRAFLALRPLWRRMGTTPAAGTRSTAAAALVRIRDCGDEAGQPARSSAAVTSAAGSATYSLEQHPTQRVPARPQTPNPRQHPEA